jgi:hypothetical protein
VTRIEGLTGEQAAWAIERFAQWVADTPGVWSVTVADVHYGKDELNLHLIVQASIDDPTSENSDKPKRVLP